ncbi:mannosyltransferase putative-domain-containing protein [Chytriomyces cf. hyalinus JEL632]|nr:mannosyltransferase putative-domain-containing protein [Chytriomyces cf. hyalinus JEL632]
MTRRVRGLLAVVVAACTLELAYLLHGYSTQEEAVGMLRRPTSRHGGPPRVLYYNTHSGTQTNMQHVMKRLGIPLVRFNPSAIKDANAMQDPRATELVNAGFARAVCEGFDFVIVADTLPHARPLIQSLIAEQEENRCQGTIIVAELTNRFDWGVADSDLYFKLIWQVSNPGNKIINLVWVENNPFESRNMADQTMATPDFRLLRPMGYTSVPARNLSSEECHRVAVFNDGKYFSPLRYMLEDFDIPLQILDRNYGGPLTLVKYRAYVEMPYQVSTMKLYENLAAGVVTFIPSSKFLQELIFKDFLWFIPTTEFFRTGAPGTTGPGWARHMDYYHPDLSPYLYYFDSWEHLREQLSAPNPDPKNVRINAPMYYENIRLKTLSGWANLFGSFGFTVLVDGKPPQQPPSPLYKASLPSIIKKRPSDLKAYEHAYLTLRKWKDTCNELYNSMRENGPRFRVTAKELTALQYKIWLFETPRQSELIDFGKHVDSVGDAKLVLLLDASNGETGTEAGDGLDAATTHIANTLFGNSLPRSPKRRDAALTDALEFLSVLMNTTDRNYSLGKHSYRAFVHSARLLRITHSLKANNQSIPFVSSELLKETFIKLDVGFDKLARLVYPWIFRGNAFPTLSAAVQSFTIERGIVFVIDNNGYERARSTMEHLRHNLNCALPIQVFYNGQYRLAYSSIRTLQEIQNVQVLDAQSLLGSDLRDQVDDTDHLKPFALFASKFKQVIYIHQDQILLQNPDTLLNSSTIFKNTGTLLFHGPVTEDVGHSEWARWLLGGVENSSNTAQQGRYMRNETKFDTDAGILAFDKSKIPVLHGLMAAAHLNRKGTREWTLDWFLNANDQYGDRETYWLGMEIARAPYKFVHGPFAIATRWSTQASQKKQADEKICGPTVFTDEFGQLSHINARDWNEEKLMTFDTLYQHTNQTQPWLTKDDTPCVRIELLLKYNTSVLPETTRDLLLMMKGHLPANGANR